MNEHVRARARRDDHRGILAREDVHRVTRHVTSFGDEPRVERRPTAAGLPGLHRHLHACALQDLDRREPDVRKEVIDQAGREELYALHDGSTTNHKPRTTNSPWWVVAGSRGVSREPSSSPRRGRARPDERRAPRARPAVCDSSRAVPLRAVLPQPPPSPRSAVRPCRAVALKWQPVASSAMSSKVSWTPSVAPQSCSSRMPGVSMRSAPLAAAPARGRSWYVVRAGPTRARRVSPAVPLRSVG